jgi:hypothetical protein
MVGKVSSFRNSAKINKMLKFAIVVIFGGLWISAGI